jgi:hypothetical protein
MRLSSCLVVTTVELDGGQIESFIGLDLEAE